MTLSTVPAPTTDAAEARTPPAADGTTACAAGGAAPGSGRRARKEVHAAGRPELAEPLQAASLDPGQLGDVYEVDSAAGLSLRALPPTGKERAADALMLLLYGLLVLRGQTPVGATQLLAAARQSGLGLERAARLLLRRPRLVTITGATSGKRYQLTPAGVEHCEELICRLLGDLKA